MRKGRDGGDKVVVVKKKIMAEIVATTSLPVDRLTAIDCNAAARAKIQLKFLCWLTSTHSDVQISAMQVYTTHQRAFY